MKKIVVALYFLGFVLCFSGTVSAQPHPGQNANGSTTGGDAIGGSSPSAPIGDGAGMMVILGIAYAVSQYKVKKEEA